MRRNCHGWTKTAVKWPNNLRCQINSYPVGGVAMGLLIAFMLGTATYPHHGLSVDLPRTFHAYPMPKAAREDALSVGVTRDGKIYLRNVPISADDLPDQIREGLRSGAEKKVYLRADARARYVDVREALIGIREAGIENVCILAEKMER
jgi:biopolymer transport protein TolR